MTMYKNDDIPPHEKSIFFLSRFIFRHLGPKKTPMIEYIPDVRFIIS